jgi:hypothetical protein
MSDANATNRKRASVKCGSEQVGGGHSTVRWRPVDDHLVGLRGISTTISIVVFR